VRVLLPWQVPCGTIGVALDAVAANKWSVVAIRSKSFLRPPPRRALAAEPSSETQQRRCALPTRRALPAVEKGLVLSEPEPSTLLITVSACEPSDRRCAACSAGLDQAERGQRPSTVMLTRAMPRPVMPITAAAALERSIIRPAM
jgi:hypothetical protein